MIEILDFVDFDALQPKWIVGYSDISTLLLAVTLKTGIATAHGTNLIDLRGEYLDETTAMWESVLKTREGESILQQPSEKYQKSGPMSIHHLLFSISLNQQIGNQSAEMQ